MMTLDGTVALAVRRETSRDGLGRQRRRRRTLGEFEQLVLLAILRLQADAHGVGIRRALEEGAGRRVSRSALYTALDRLESKGLVRWRLAPGADERARLLRRAYAVTAKGLTAVRSSHRALARMSHGLGSILKDSGA